MTTTTSVTKTKKPAKKKERAPLGSIKKTPPAPIVFTGIVDSKVKLDSLLKKKTDHELIHPFAEIFPALSEGESEAMQRSILTSGLREKMKTYDGRIIDGRNRFFAMVEAVDGFAEAMDKIRGFPISQSDPIRKHFEDAGLKTDHEALQYVIDHNMTRRQLSQSQKAAIAAQCATYTRQDAASIGSSARWGNEPPDSKNSPIKVSIQEAADAFGVARTAVVAAKKVYASNPKLMDKVTDGSATIQDASQYSKFLDEGKGKEFLPNIMSGKISIKDAIKELKGDVKKVEKKDGVEDNASINAQLEEAQEKIREMLNYIKKHLGDAHWQVVADFAEDNNSAVQMFKFGEAIE